MDKHDEFFDELVGLGVNFTDETAPKAMPKMERERKSDTKEDNPSVCSTGTQRPLHKGACEAADAKYAHVPKYAPNIFDRLKGCAKWAVTFGSLSMLFFYWQQTGLMDPAAAVPSMCACTCLAGYGVGKHALR